jgi:hypothetical protein
LKKYIKNPSGIQLGGFFYEEKGVLRNGKDDSKANAIL